MRLKTRNDAAFLGHTTTSFRPNAALNYEQFDVLVRYQRWRQNARRRRHQLVVVVMMMMVMVRGKMSRVMMMVVGRMWQMRMFIVGRRSGSARRTGGTDQGCMLEVNRRWRWYCLNRGQLRPWVGTGKPGTGRSRYTRNR